MTTTIFDVAKVFRTAIVGGYVRDLHLGLDPKDIDYVVEADEFAFEQAFPNIQRVGAAFPVYLVEGDEVALTRSEKSTGEKYQDFEFVAGVTIEEDLARRDFTINSIAIELISGDVIDPFNGLSDLKSGLLRSINKVAFVEDPLRILRGFRFAARFGFIIENETLILAGESVHRLTSITPERIELELRKVYEQSAKPSEFFRHLDSIGALVPAGFKELERAKVVPAGKVEWHPEGSVFNHLLEAFDRAKESDYSFSVGIAALLHDLGKLATPEEEWPSHIGHENRTEVVRDFFSRHRFDSRTEELTKIVNKHHMRVHVVERIKKPVKLIRFIRSIRDHHFEEFLRAADCDARLTSSQRKVISLARKAVKSTVIEISPELQKKGKDAIVAFVENKIVETLKALSKAP